MLKQPQSPNLLVVLCLVAVLAVALIFSLGAGTTQEAVASIPPQSQTASFWSSFTSFVSHAFAPVVQAVTSVVNSVGKFLHDAQCNVWGYGIQTLYGSCNSTNSGGAGGGGAGAKKIPPANCGVDTTSQTACGFSVSIPGAIPGASAQVAPGGSATLTWNCPAGMGYTSSSGSGAGFSTNGALSGSMAVSPQQTTAYTLTCQAPLGNSTGSVLVTMAPSTLSISAAQTRVHGGSPTTLSWSASGLTSGTACSIYSHPTGIFSSTWSGAGSSWSGSGVQTSAIAQETTFVISCGLPGGPQSTKSVTVDLIPTVKEI